MYEVFCEFPEGHELYTEFGDTMTYDDLGYAEEYYLDAIHDGCINALLTKIDTYYGRVVDESVLRKFENGKEVINKFEEET